METTENQKSSIKLTPKFRLKIATAYKKILKMSKTNPYVVKEMPGIFSARFVEKKIGTSKKMHENQDFTPTANFRENSENKQIFPIS